MLALYRAVCYTIGEVINDMETKDILLALRMKKGLSRDELAEKMKKMPHGWRDTLNGESAATKSSHRPIKRFVGTLFI